MDGSQKSKSSEADSDNFDQIGNDPDFQLIEQDLLPARLCCLEARTSQLSPSLECYGAAGNPLPLAKGRGETNGMGQTTGEHDRGDDLIAFCLACQQFRSVNNVA